MPGPNDMVRINGSMNLNQAYSAQQITISSGNYLTLNGYVLSATGGITNNGYLVLNGNETITGTLTNAAGSTVRYTGSGTFNTLAGGTSYTNLEFANNQGEWRADGNLTVAGSFNIASGKFYLGNKNMTVNGDFTAANSQVFDAGTGLVKFDNPGGTSSIHGTTFSNLTVTPGTTLVIDAGRTETINGALSMVGTAAQPIVLKSSTAGQQWFIEPKGTVDIAYVNVQDSNNIGNSITVVSGGTNLGNNTNWNFGAVAPVAPVPPASSSSVSTPASTLSTTTTITGENVLFRNQMPKSIEYSSYITIIVPAPAAAPAAATPAAAVPAIAPAYLFDGTFTVEEMPKMVKPDVILHITVTIDLPRAEVFTGMACTVTMPAIVGYDEIKSMVLSAELPDPAVFAGANAGAATQRIVTPDAFRNIDSRARLPGLARFTGTMSESVGPAIITPDTFRKATGSKE